MVRFKLTARKILREELLKVVSLYYITLFICKFLYWLPVGLVINTCACPYTLFVFLREENSAWCEAATQPNSCFTFKEMEVVGVDKAEEVDEMEVNIHIYLCVSVKIGQNQRLSLFFSHNRPDKGTKYTCVFLLFSCPGP